MICTTDSEKILVGLMVLCPFSAPFPSVVKLHSLSFRELYEALLDIASTAHNVMGLN